ncbi:hypothetical protein [Nocardioides sp. Root140]|uniref:hypothetical protein n=1 Tax=Nocardioides sp. Root140 TaxID=1736460 RepID=UPI0006FD7B6F|nr:hypothetical protein [Nocardioides sp. Root140]KQY62629.1 hypothetical protein ASD30_23200 [Nocardioides sp. Root140]
MSEQPPYPPSDPNQPGWGQPPPAGPPGWGQQPPGWGQQPPGPPPGGRGFAATEAIGYGWKAFTTHTGALLGAALIVLLVPIAIQVVSALTTGGQTFSFTADSSGGGFEFDFHPMALVLNLLGSIISLILSAAMVRLALDVVDGQQVSVGAMFSRFDLVQVLIAAVVLSIATTIGLALCVLPGLVVLFLTFLTNYFIVGKGQDAFTAIRSSVSLTTANVGELLLLALLCFLCMLGGAVACGVGLLVALPVITVATAFAFRALQGEPVRPL